MEDKRYNYKVYTPNGIAKDIARKGIELYFEERGKNEKSLGEVRVCDLSCGNGNLLLPALEELIILSKKICGEYRYNPQWITGFDIDEGAVKLTRLKIKELLKHYFLDGEICVYVKNGLLVEGEYNILLGNPPYLGEKNNKEVFQEIKNTPFGKKYYEGKMDYFYFFIEKGVEILAKDGVLIYLTTNYWLKADSGNKLRLALKENGKYREIIFYDNSLFIKAKGQHNIIFSWEKREVERKKIKVELPEKSFSISNDEIYDENFKIVLADRETREYNKRVLEISNYKLGDLVNINQGIVSGCDKAFVFKEYNREFENYLKPFYKNKDIGKYTNDKNSFWILYLDKNVELDSELRDYLDRFYEELSSRREVTKGQIEWWQLQWARDREIFSKPKILVRQRCKTNQFSYDEGEFYGSADIYFITTKNEDINIFYILGYMNSTSFLEWFKYNGKSKGKNYEFYSTPLKETPIYYPDKSEEIQYIEGLVRKQIESYDEGVQEEIDRYFVEIYKR